MKKKEKVPQGWISYSQMYFSINNNPSIYQKHRDGLIKIIDLFKKDDSCKNHFGRFINPQTGKGAIFFSPIFVEKTRKIYLSLRRKPTEKGWIDIMKSVPVLYGGIYHFIYYAKKYVAEEKKLRRFYIDGLGGIVILFSVELIKKVEEDMRKQDDFFLKNVLSEKNIHKFEVFENL